MSKKNTLGGGPVTAAEGIKHEAFWHSMNGLRYAVGELEGLVTRVENGSLDNEVGETDEPMPSLAHFLGGGAERVSEITARIRKINSCLNSLLFEG